MMDERQKKNTLKIVIIILAVLLAISLAALAGTLIYQHFSPAGPSSVIVPDNIITPEVDTGDVTQPAPAETTENTKAATESSPSQPSGGTEGADERTAPTTQPTVPNPVTGGTNKTATAIYLYNRNPGDNTPFQAGNLFPGDLETKYFRIQVSFTDTVTVHYHADIRPGHEKLAEVLKCRIVLLTTGETMYDGLMRDMPESIDHVLYTATETTTDLYYEITVYLDAGVGNAYQNKELIADFRWWVAEDDHLIEPPQTGDDANLALWFGLMIGSLFVLILLFVRRKKEERHEQYR